MKSVRANVRARRSSRRTWLSIGSSLGRRADRNGPVPAPPPPAPRVRRRLRLVQRTQESLRRQAALASCHTGGHEIGWTVQAETRAGAARLLPLHVAQRTTVTCVGEVEIP